MIIIILVIIIIPVSGNSVKTYFDLTLFQFYHALVYQKECNIRLPTTFYHYFYDNVHVDVKKTLDREWKSKTKQKTNNDHSSMSRLIILPTQPTFLLQCLPVNLLAQSTAPRVTEEKQSHLTVPSFLITLLYFFNTLEDCAR